MCKIYHKVILPQFESQSWLVKTRHRKKAELPFGPKDMKSVLFSKA